MKKEYIIFLVIILIIVIITFRGGQEIKEDVVTEVCFEENCFQVEIADTNEEHERGLMFREELCSDCGMLFIYDEEVKSKFWMKNTLIPLDIIWLNSDLEVVHVANAVPCVMEECELYGPDLEKAQYVLEVNSGISKNIGLEKGSTLRVQ